MCGITGFISKQGTRNKLVEMTDRLTHRGPDAGGYYFNENQGVGLGHRRLSILDLSENANQPFYSKDRRYIMVFNGEVYNYNELAKKYSIQQTTTSDTEVLIELFSKKGFSFVKELNGMFVMAIWDTKEESLWLFRDRLGIKPLYFHHDGNELAFASELKSLKPYCKSINSNALSYYFHFGYIPQPYSIYNEVTKFPSGHYAKFHKGNLVIEPFWELETHIGEEIISDEKTALKELEDLLYSSIKYRLISDVPLGTFLSGGIDSSLVTALAQDVSPGNINTFSIGFRNSSQSELQYAEQVAKHLKTNHHQYILEQEEGVEIAKKLFKVYDEPFADTSSLPTYLVSQKTRQQVTVALSGDGGDELFMGYGMYGWAERLSKPHLSALRKPISKLLQLKSSSLSNKKASKLFDYGSRSELKSHIFSQEQLFFSKKEIKNFLNGTDFELLNESINAKRNLSPKEQQAIFDLNFYLKDNLLVKVDRASMANSLEVRVPILDHRIVEFSMNLSEKLKIRENQSKYLLKQVLYKKVPKHIFDRPKQGFAISKANWLRTGFQSTLEAELVQEKLEAHGLFNAAEVNSIYEKFKNGDDYYAKKLWQILVFQQWYYNQDL